MTDEKTQRIALYARVSSEEQKQGHTMDSQLAELRQFAEANQWSIVETYADEAWSGAALARPALDRLRDDASKNRFDAVLINDVDRLARDVTHLGVIKKDLERSGIKVIFRKIPSENSPTHNLLVNILGSFAEFERELILDRTRRGRRHKVEARQQFIGAIAPYGYRYHPPTNDNQAGELTKNVEEAAVVRDIYAWVDQEGLSARQVTDRLTASGIRPRKRGNRWGKSTVLRVLRSRTYIGFWYYNKNRLSEPLSIFPGSQHIRKSSLRLRPKSEWIQVKLPDSLHIISREQWERVQLQLDRNRSFSSRNSKHEYLLRGLVRCGGCSAAFVGSTTHGYFHYRCARRCKLRREVSEATLDKAVWTAIETALKNPQILERAIQDIKTPVAPTTVAPDETGRALNAIRIEEERILEAYRRQIIDADQLGRELASIRDRRKVLQKSALAANPPPKVPVHTTVQQFCEDIKRRLPGLTFETKRSIIRLLLRKITFEGTAVRIAGVIPYVGSGGIAATGSRSYGRNSSADGGIATTTPNSFGLNHTLENPANMPYGEILFEFTHEVKPDLTAKLAASRANLVKANAVNAARRRLAATQHGQPEKVA